MKTTRLALLVMTAAALSASVALADESPSTPGTFELSTSVGFNRSTYNVENSDVSNSNTTLNAAIGLGRSITPNTEVNGALLLQHRALASEGRNGFGASLGGTYNFNQQGNLIPFVAASVGGLAYSADSGTDKSLLLPMVRVGFRSMIGDNKSLNVSMGYQHESNSQSTVAGSSNVFDVGIGVSLFQSR